MEYSSVEMQRVLFFVPEWPALDSAVLHAQVLSVAGFLNRSGFECEFVGAETTVERAEEARDAICRQYAIEARVFPCLKARSSGIDLWRTCKEVFRQIDRDEGIKHFTHIYARSVAAGYWTRKLASRKRRLSVYDVRGVTAEEQFLKDRSRVKRAIIASLEKRDICEADRVATVSRRLGEQIAANTGRDDVVVIPSCFDDARFKYDAIARFEVRSELGISDNQIVLCYSGGVAQWQRIEDTVRLIKSMCVTMPACKALFISHEKEELCRLFRDSDMPERAAIVRSCRHEEMPRLLSAADVGIVLRHNTNINNVASPIKVAEYLACGLPVVLAPGVGDYSQMVAAAGIGLVLNESEPVLPQVKSFIEQSDWRALKKQVVEFANNNLSMSANLERYRQLYRY